MKVFVFLFGLMSCCACQTKQYNLTQSVIESAQVQEIFAAISADVLFLQWNIKEPIDTSNYFEFIDKRDILVYDIAQKLKAKSLGETIASEVNNNRVNVFFRVTEFVQSTSTIVDVLQRKEIEDECVIAKRNFKSDSSWVYGTLFPLDESKIFEEP